MTYERIPYKAPGVKTQTCPLPMAMETAEVPVFDYPVTPVENFRLAAARKTPYWVPSALSDMHFVSHRMVFADKIGQPPSPPGIPSGTFTDWFGVEWTFVPMVGGAMPTPGKHTLKDITRWEKDVVFPVLDDYDWREKLQKFLDTEYVDGKVINFNFGQGITEALIALMGGYTEGMLAFAEEPEAVRAFFDRHADFAIEMIDKVYEVMPFHMYSYHDDWGTEKDTFFSREMLMELIYEPTKRIIDHVHSKGAAFQHHCCGNIMRFLPEMCGLKIDFLQIQRRAVDIPKMKEKYGDKIGFNTFIEDLDFGQPVEREELIQKVRKTVDLYCKNGGFFTSFGAMAPELMWDAECEFYAYSREYYDREREEKLATV